MADEPPQNGVQAFYLVSRFHDHLAGPDVGFDDASGNFEVGGTGGDDPVLTQTDDGAGYGSRRRPGRRTIATTRT